MASTIDTEDASSDRLHLILFKALKHYTEEELLDFVGDENITLRTTAARHLHLIGGRKTFDHAKRMLTADRFDTREIGAFILGQLGSPQHPFGAETIELLGDALDDKYFEVRSAVVESIGYLVAGGVYLPDGMLNTLLSLTSDESLIVRQSVASTLGFCHDPRARISLDKLCADPEVAVREAAEFSLSCLDSR